MQVVLTGKQFKELVSGNKISLTVPCGPQSAFETVELSLDLGFRVMRNYIDEAEGGQTLDGRSL